MDPRNRVCACSAGSLVQLWVCKAVFLVIPLAGFSICAQSPNRPPTVQTYAAPENELATRLLNAQAARENGSATTISEANILVVASAARELGDLRAAESAYVQAAELYKTADALEPRPDTLLALATVDAQAGNYSEAIEIANKIHGTDSENLQAARVLSSSLVQKGDFVAALEPLERVAATDHSVATQYALANCLLQTKRAPDKARAEQIFERIATEHGDSGSPHVLIGRAYRDADDLPSAINQFQKALAIDPRTPHANYFLGLARLSQNEWRPTPEAKEYIRREAQLYPEDYLANFMSGFLLSEERHYPEAEPFLKKAAALDPRVPDPWLYLGLNAYANGDLAGAEMDLRQAVKLTGSDEARSNYQIRRAYVDLGRILASSGRKEESEVFLKKARDLQIETMKLTQQTVASMAGGASAAAVVSLPSSIADHPGPAGDETAPVDIKLLGDDTHLTGEQRATFKQRDAQLRSILALAYNDLGTSEAMQGHFDAASTLYRKAEDWDSTLPGLEQNLGQSEFRAGNFNGAISPLSQALLQQPSSRGVRAMLGISFYNLNRFAEAARTFEPLDLPGMRDPEVGYAWAASLARTGDNLRAADVLTAFTGGPQRSPEVLLLVGQLWTAIGDYARAIQTIQQALAADPDLPKAHFYAGLADIHWEHWPEAATEFQAELAANPDDPDAQYHLGFVYMQQANTQGALKLFRQVVAAHPDYANAQYQLGKTDLDNGDAQSAIKHLEAAERSSPQTAYIHYQLQAAYRKASRSDDAEKELALYKQLKADARAQAAERAAIH